MAAGAIAGAVLGGTTIGALGAFVGALVGAAVAARLNEAVETNAAGRALKPRLLRPASWIRRPSSQRAR